MSRIKRTTAKLTTTPAPASPRSMAGQGVPTKASDADRPIPTPATQLPRRTVCFEFVAPGAQKVSVVGTFNNWAQGATPLVLQGGTKWMRLVPLAPGRYEYRFVVDGYWADDPNAKDYTPNPFGGMNAVLTVADSE